MRGPRERKIVMRITKRRCEFQIACWLLALVVAGLCGSVRATAETRKVTEADNGTAIRLRAGDTLEVMLKANPSTGYMWYVQPKSTALLKIAGQSQTEPEQPGVGRPIFQIFRFTVREAGKGDLLLHYVRSWEPPQDSDQRFILHVEIE